MSTSGDNATPAVAAGPSSGGARALLVVVEPPSGGSEAVGMVGAAGAVLLTEGARLARDLGVDPHFVTWPAGAEVDPELLAAALADLVEHTRARAVVLADTDVGRQLAPMVAHRLGSGAVVGCSDVLLREEAEGGGRAGRRADGGPGSCAEGGRGPRTLAFVKPVYGGWLEREIEPGAGVVPVATLDLTGMEAPDSPSDGLPTPEVLQIEVGAPGAQPHVQHLETIPPDPRSVDLVHARRIVAAGAGSASEDLLAAVRELAELLEGSVGATRPVVDDGRLPKERLIGQTGRTVTPELYLALGISGSPHHVAGVRKADRILSINRDVRAPIFQFSDVGYVADLEVVLPGLVQRIKEWRDAPGSPD